MHTQAEINAIAEVVSDPANAGADAEMIARLILDVVAGFRRRPYQYVTIAQDRRREADTPLRQFHPTWVRGPFQTKLEAHMAADRERGPLRNPTGIKVMTAQVFGPDDPVDPDQLKEVLA
jgi:hypothetical protein